MINPTVKLFDNVTEYDISGQCQSVSVQRGRSDELDAIVATTGAIQLINYDRNFDPPDLNGSTAFGTIRPGMRVEIWDAAVQVFAGMVLDWDYSWTADKRSTASIYLTDTLGTLGGATFTEWQANDLEEAGTRITAALDRAEVDFPTGASYRNIGIGLDPLQGDIVAAGTNVLGYLQLAAKSDLGRLYVTRDGVLTYRNRHDTQGTIGTQAFSSVGVGDASFVGAGTWLVERNNSPYTVQLPAGIVEGDFLILVANIASTGTLALVTSGWTQEQLSGQQGIWTKFVGASESAPQVSNTQTQVMSARIYAFRGVVDPRVVEDSDAVSGGSPGAMPVMGPLTVTSSGALLFAVVQANDTVSNPFGAMPTTDNWVEIHTVENTTDGGSWEVYLGAAYATVADGTYAVPRWVSGGPTTPVRYGSAYGFEPE